MPDPLIAAQKGADNTPAFRGLAYLVLRGFDVSAFGNRVPQLSFEVFRQLVQSPPSPAPFVCFLARPSSDITPNNKSACWAYRVRQRKTSTNRSRHPIGRCRSTNCSKANRNVDAWHWWSAGSAQICAPSSAVSNRAQMDARKISGPPFMQLMDAVGRG